MIEVHSTRVRVRVRPIQTSHTADDVEKVNGCPGKRHAEIAKTTARLLCLHTQFLQLLLVLQRDMRCVIEELKRYRRSYNICNSPSGGPANMDGKYCSTQTELSNSRD